MGNDQHERFFKLLAKVSMMVVNGNRFPYYVYSVISGKRHLAKLGEGKSWYQMINEELAFILSTQGYSLQPAITGLQEIVDGPKPVFVEFRVQGGPPMCQYCIGVSLQAILHQSKNATEWAGWRVTSYRQLHENQLRAAGVGLMDEGIFAIRKGCSSFSLDSRKVRPIWS